MLELKRKARNKARVEGSICEAYISEEISNFCSLYFEPHIETRRTRPPRNDDGGEPNASNQLSLFQYPVRAFGRSWPRSLNEEELKAASLYILLNCTELEPYIK